MVTVPSLTMCNPTRGKVESMIPSTSLGGKRIKATVATIPVATSIMTVPSSPVSKSTIPTSSGQSKPQLYKQMPRLAPIQQSASLDKPRSPLPQSAPRSPSMYKSHSVDSAKDIGVRQKRALDDTDARLESSTNRSQDERHVDRVLGKAPPSKLIITDTSGQSVEQSSGGQQAIQTAPQPNRTERISKTLISSAGSGQPFQLGKVPEGKSAKKTGGSPQPGGSSSEQSSGNPPGDAESEEKPQRSCKGKLYQKILEQSGMKKAQKEKKKVRN